MLSDYQNQFVRFGHDLSLVGDINNNVLRVAGNNGRNAVVPEPSALFLTLTVLALTLGRGRRRQ